MRSRKKGEKLNFLEQPDCALIEEFLFQVDYPTFVIPLLKIDRIQRENFVRNSGHIDFRSQLQIRPSTEKSNQDAS